MFMILLDIIYEAAENSLPAVINRIISRALIIHPYVCLSLIAVTDSGMSLFFTLSSYDIVKDHL